MKSVVRSIILLALLVATAWIGWLVWQRLQAQRQGATASHGKEARPAPVEVAPIEHGRIELRRTFSGALETRATFIIAPEVGGRLAALSVDLADVVTRGQEVARLGDAEFKQTVATAAADLAVAKAGLEGAKSGQLMADHQLTVAGHELTIAEHELTIAARELVIAEREREIAGVELQRVTTLRKRGVASETQYDAAQSRDLAAESALLTVQTKKVRAETVKLNAQTGLSIAEVGKLAAAAEVETAAAQVGKFESLVEAARIRLGYTKVLAGWSGPDNQRVVAERLVNEGEAVTANQPLLRLVQLDPINAVVFVTEQDYARLRLGQTATMQTDAYPNETFHARIERISPVFSQQTRQVRVELTVDNGDRRLKPGMFVRVAVVLDSFDDAVIVPHRALMTRDNKTGVFVVDSDGKTVSWQPVSVGVVDDGRVQILGAELTGRVVTLGQQLVDDNSAVTISESLSPTP